LIFFGAPLHAQAPAEFDPAALVARSDSFAFVSGGAAIGGQRLTLERVAEGWRFTESTRIGDRMRQETTLLLSPDLAPVSVRQTGSAMGDSMGTALDYEDGRVTGGSRTPSPDGAMTEKVIDLDVPAGVVDDNALQLLLPALAWSPGAAWALPVFSGGRAAVVDVVLTVTGVETVVVPAGTFETYRVEARREEAPAVFWVTTSEPHVVVKGGSLVAPFELQLVASAPEQALGASSEGSGTRGDAATP
jgi:hypothetical protein